MSLPQTPRLLGESDGQEPDTNDVLGGFHHPLHCLTVSHGAAVVPHSDVGQDALDSAAVEDRRPLFSQKVKPLLRLEVLKDQERSSDMWTSRILKLETDSEWECVCHLFSSLVLMVLRGNMLPGAGPPLCRLICLLP